MTDTARRGGVRVSTPDATLLARHHEDGVVSMMGRLALDLLDARAENAKLLAVARAARQVVTARIAGDNFALLRGALEALEMR